MKPSAPRGHALALLLVVIATLGITAALIHGRLDATIRTRKHDALRTQAAWLARSAALTGNASKTPRQVRIDAQHAFAVRSATTAGASTRIEATLDGGVLTAWAEVERTSAGEVRIVREGIERAH